MSDATLPPNPAAPRVEPIRPPAASTPASTVDMLKQLFQEISGYARDLMRMFQTELAEKSRSMRTLVALGGAAALFGLFSFAFLSGALIGAIAYGLASWRWALLIVGVGYGIIAMLLLLPVSHALRGGLLSFEHTKRHLKEDAEWIKQKLAA